MLTSEALCPQECDGPSRGVRQDPKPPRNLGTSLSRGRQIWLDYSQIWPTSQTGKHQQVEGEFQMDPA